MISCEFMRSDASLLVTDLNFAPRIVRMVNLKKKQRARVANEDIDSERGSQRGSL